MNKMKYNYQTIILIILTLVGRASYGQLLLELDTPSTNTEIFAPKIISTNQKQRDLAISPDGTEIYYTVYNNGFDGNILFIKKTGDTWSTPSLASFSGNGKDLEPAFADNGNKLYFSSSRGSGGDYDIYYVERTNGGQWSSPIDVGAVINTSVNEFYPSVANDGSIYYTAKYSHGVGGEDIWYAQYLDGVYQTPIPLPNINTEFDEFNAYVDPNEKFIYFGSYGRPGSNGGGDIYSSTKPDNDTWTSGSALIKVNTSSLDYSPYVSPDGRFLFFTSERNVRASESSDNPFDLNAVVNSILLPHGPGSNIYWIKR